MEALIIIPTIIAVWLGIERYTEWRHSRREEREKQKALEQAMLNYLSNFETNWYDTMYKLEDLLANIDTKETFESLDPTQLKQLTDNLSKN